MDPVTAFTLPDIPIQSCVDPELEKTGTRVDVLRLDLLDPVISGNKWFKLKYNLTRARTEGRQTLLSFGGAWSNHLHALAEAGRRFGFRTIGIVRGEPGEGLTACLEDAQAAGMILEWAGRDAYRNRDGAEFLTALRQRHGDFYQIPEGGANREGAMGCAEIVSLYDQAHYDLVCLACGTGTTLAGMASASQTDLLGFQVLKGTGYLAGRVTALGRTWDLPLVCRWAVNDDFHGGGYAKTTPVLERFIQQFEHRHGIPLEPVYSGKMVMGLFELVKKRDFFPQNSRILLIHGGGLQGRRGFKT